MARCNQVWDETWIDEEGSCVGVRSAIAPLPRAAVRERARRLLRRSATLAPGGTAIRREPVKSVSSRQNWGDPGESD